MVTVDRHIRNTNYVLGIQIYSLHIQVLHELVIIVNGICHFVIGVIYDL